MGACGAHLPFILEGHTQRGQLGAAMGHIRRALLGQPLRGVPLSPAALQLEQRGGPARARLRQALLQKLQLGLEHCYALPGVVLVAALARHARRKVDGLCRQEPLFERSVQAAAHLQVARQGLDLVLQKRRDGLQLAHAQRRV